MAFDYAKLKGLITEKYSSQSEFSKSIGISEHSLSNKINGKVEWKQLEIYSICNLLNIPFRKIPEYFFTEKVQSN